VPSTPPSGGVKPLTAEEQRHAEWLKEYEAVQAARLAREAKLKTDNLMSEEEFRRELLAMADE